MLTVKPDPINTNCSASDEIREQRLTILKQTGHENANNTFASIPYLPLWEIFAPGSDTLQQLKEIPSGAILQFVRPRYDLVEWIGTLMHVSHQGIVVHKEIKYYCAMHQPLQTKSPKSHSKNIWKNIG